MSFFGKIAAAAAGTFAAIALSAASAAVVVSSPDSSTTLSDGNPILIDNDDLATGALYDEAYFDVAFVNSATGTVDVRFSSGQSAGISNLVLTFQVAGLADQVFEVTNSSGLQTLFNFALDILPNTPVTMIATGLVYEPLSQANYNVTLIADPVPLPAAGLFLMTGLAGAAGLRLRKQAA